MTDRIAVEINGQQFDAQASQTLIQVADAADIYIPRFCYHPKLSIAANCRMCLVEVVDAPRLMPACALPVTPGLKIRTNSQKVKEAQRAVMEFLLINHPLDCPVCDQGGECELQDLYLTYGKTGSNFTQAKRAAAQLDLGPFIATEMTRCIQCTRCVRFGEEVAGLRELGAINRGEDMAISTYVSQSLRSEVSGNMIDICPVGALTAKPSRFYGRAWELRQLPSISPHDCVGANINVHVANDKVVRVVPRANPAINESWIADRDRFAYLGLYHEERLTKPLIKRDGVWQETSWSSAIHAIAINLQQIITHNGSDQLGVLANSGVTLEEAYLLQKLTRGLGSSNIDHRLRQLDFTDQAEMPLMPLLGVDFAALSTMSSVLLISSNIQQEQPLLALRIRQAQLHGAEIASVNVLDYDTCFSQYAKFIGAVDSLIISLAQIAKACIALSPDYIVPAKLEQLLASVSYNEEHYKVAYSLANKAPGIVILGSLAFNDLRGGTIRKLARLIAAITGAQLGWLSEGPNTAGAWLTGLVPHRRIAGKVNTHIGLNALGMLEKPRRAYILFNVDPMLDFAKPGLAMAALAQADLVVACTSFTSSALLNTAHVLLPLAPFTENSGTYINASNTWQDFQPAVPTLEHTRQGWQILTALGHAMLGEDYNYNTCAQITTELSAATDQASYKIPEVSWKDVVLPLTAKDINNFSVIIDVPMYVLDAISRRSKALQDMQVKLLEDLVAVRLHPDSGMVAGQQVVLQANDHKIEASVILDPRVPPQAVVIFAGTGANYDLIGDATVSLRAAK